MGYKPVTGTSIDEITCDIASQNWGRAEWEREFDTYRDNGMDTVILIRAGMGARLACPSTVVARHVPTPAAHGLFDRYREHVAEQAK